MSLAMEIVEVSLSYSTWKTRDIWNSLHYFTIRRSIFISSKPPPSTFLKVNFDGNVIDGIGGVRFLIRGPNSRLVMAKGVRLVDTSMPRAEMRVA